MRKYSLILGILFLLLLSPSTAFAADALYRMLHANEVEQFREDQDAIIVGQLIDKQGNNFKVMVIKVLSGKVSSDSILVSDDFTYGWNKETPSLDDFCVFSLKKWGNYYKKAWGIFEASSGDYRTLSLKSLNAPSAGLQGDLAAIQWYVNTGGSEKDFSFTNSATYVRRTNGQVVQIYPTPNSGEDAMSYDNAISEIQDTPPENDMIQDALPETSKIQSNTFNYVLLSAVGLIGIVRLPYIRQKRKII